MDERPSRQRIPRLWVPSVLLLAICLVQAGLSPAASKATVGEQGLAPIRSYIAASWDALTRSMTQCDSVVDPKLAGRSVLYLPADFPVPPAVAQMQKKCSVQVEHLPVVITGPGQVDPAKLGAPGLLYLENSYVVPGGRFNEMYGWDSYFIIRGLLADGRIDKARAMVENFFFEIEHYGTILNANRTYFLTRSQPPFLTSEILGVYEAQKATGHEDGAWLEKAYGYAAKDYEMWNREPHLAGSTGLSRYYDFGNGPAPEAIKDESGFHRKVAAYALLRSEEHTSELQSRGHLVCRLLLEKTSRAHRHVHSFPTRRSSDLAWLEKAYGYAAKDYEMWNREPHLAGSTGLSRYYDFGNGPAPEAIKDESGFHRKVAAYALLHPEWGRNYVVADNAQPVVGFQYSVQV